MNTILPASAAIRRRNSRAVATRARWRRQYAELVQEIKAAKQAVREDPRGRATKLRLRTLQLSAQVMMIDRGMITDDLILTAYKWV